MKLKNFGHIGGGWVGGFPNIFYIIVLINLHINLSRLQIFENICDITILMIISQISIFCKMMKFCFWVRKNKIEFLENKA